MSNSTGREIDIPKGEAAPHLGHRRFARFGPIAVSFAVATAILTLLVFADFTPIKPNSVVVLGFFIANVVIILLLFVLLIAEGARLYRARRAQQAGARLHLRIVALFSIIAAVPAILISTVGSITLDRSLNPAFMQDVRGFIYNTAEAARLFRESQCRSLLQEAALTATDLDRARGLMDVDRKLYLDLFTSRTKFLGFASAALMKADGSLVETVPSDAAKSIFKPEATDFDDARKNEPLCLVIDEGRSFVALRKLPSADDLFLYAARPIDPFAVQFPTQASNLINLFENFDAHRRNIQLAFATMFVLIALVMLLSATWMGLAFATRLVTPIRRLISATDQVSSGNLYVQVPVNPSDGELNSLGETFNKMTSELRLQQNRLIAASELIEARRAFTESVLSGVPVAVIGLDGEGRVNVINPSALKLLSLSIERAIGEPLNEVIPELTAILAESQSTPQRPVQSQMTIVREGRERTVNVRLSTNTTGETYYSVITLDDITDLVQAQRTSAWADVARRIAHEIRNPLTPIQLSAERLQRKYGRMIETDKDIFNQCTDTIIRQVDDIKRMVDEFSSFARMPKARAEEDDISSCVRQVLFLMRVGNADIDIIEDDQLDITRAVFDRRLLSQALTNVIKNAIEGIKAADHPSAHPCVRVRLTHDQNDHIVIDVIDNGIGFPVENRQRLLEPYMTTRSEGTGLGLPIVAKVLEDHGGGIELLDSPTPPGACVRLYFPRLGKLDISIDAASSHAVSTEGL